MENSDQCIKRNKERLQLRRFKRPDPLYHNRILPTRISSGNQVIKNKNESNPKLTSRIEGLEIEIYFK